MTNIIIKGSMLIILSFHYIYIYIMTCISIHCMYIHYGFTNSKFILLPITGIYDIFVIESVN